MKPIRPLSSPTPGLAYYSSQVQGQPSWSNFRGYDGGNSFRELISGLVEVQHGLCGYCEINLLERDRQVEHFIPQSAKPNGPANALDHSNMIACCIGGSAANLFGPGVLMPDTERSLPPPKGNLSCGSAKENLVDPQLIDPRTLEAFPSLFKVRSDGGIVPNNSACTSTSFPMSRVKKTIEILGLNVPRLSRARASRWENLALVWGNDLNDPVRARLAAKAELLPNSGYVLPKFFTTSRSFFGTLGDSVLSTNPNAWV